jgi:hypothetical protein
MGILLRNLSGFQRGVELDEVGINIESLEVRIFPEWKEKLPNKDNQTRGFAEPDAPSREVTLQGEISGATGVMAAAFGTPLVLLNDIDGFGSGDGDLYMDEATISQARGEWKKLSMKLSSDPLVEGSS